MDVHCFFVAVKTQGIRCYFATGSVAMFTLEVLRQKARKTVEVPARVAVYDMIAAAKGRDNKYASKVFKRHLKEGTMPACEEVDASMISPDTGNEVIGHGGRNRKKILVGTLQEIVQILWALPGGANFKKNSADVVVRYLGGDCTLLDEVWRNRELQKALGQADPHHPARLFGEAAQLSGKKRPHEIMIHTAVQEAVDAAEDRILRKFDEALRRIQSIDPSREFANSTRSHSTLMDIGVIVEGEELARLDEDEHVVRITDFLQDRVTRTTWVRHGGKLKNIFAIELKKAKLQESRDTGLPPPIARAQGEYRIVYTDADNDLMVRIFDQCLRQFRGIVTHDAAAMRAHRAQRSIQDYFGMLGEGWDRKSVKSKVHGVWQCSHAISMS